MDFALLPPEVNSARMYTGPGAGPLIAAAVAWDGLAAHLHAIAASYRSVMSELALVWQGPSSAAMTTAVAPYAAWMVTSAGQAERTADQLRAAITAFETAFTATVPPPIIAANRMLLISLIATNLFGQNTAAIAAAEAHYAQMWAQDAAAMYGYAGASSTARQLTPFTTPRQIVNPGATLAHSAAATSSTVGATNAVQGYAGATSAAVSTAPSAAPSTSELSQFLVGPFNPLKLYEPFGGNYDFSFQNVLAELNRQNLQLAYDGAVSRAAAGLGPAVTYSGGQPVLAGFARSAVVGDLSVPPSWVSAAPAIKPIAFAVPQADSAVAAAALSGESSSSLFSNMGLSGLAGRAVVGIDGNAARSISAGRAALPGEATSATIIVIPEDD